MIPLHSHSDFCATLKKPQTVPSAKSWRCATKDGKFVVSCESTFSGKDKLKLSYTKVERIVKCSDYTRWIKDEENEETLPIFAKTPCPELKITQEMRQDAFDDYSTTDDHGMHIYGKAKDQNGTEYYMVKNSWGKVGSYNGIWYVSKEYVRYKTTNIVVNKNAIPTEIREKLKHANPNI